MERNILVPLLLVSILKIASSSPFQPPQQPDMNPLHPDTSNIPKCLQPAQSGLCLAYFQMYHYNVDKDTCETFIYGGCGGNDNKFPTFEACMAECGGYQATTQVFTLRTESDEDKSDSGSEEENICSLPPVTGSCRAAMPRFYFNGDRCESFLYGGCEGNANNFHSEAECRKKCGPKSEESESSAENSASVEESNQTE